MRRALEVAWLSAYRFARTPPTFAGLDDVRAPPPRLAPRRRLRGGPRLAACSFWQVVFKKPVEVGRLVEYIGRVVYAADDGSLRVTVEAHKVSLRTGAREPTNQFHFIFRRKASGTSPPPLIVQPDTYEEGMLYLEGRRRWLNDGGTGLGAPWYEVEEKAFGC